jgi:Tol biopolymer transport system component/DNA-binding winged helix-turn-helix (wHTH) protein
MAEAKDFFDFGRFTLNISDQSLMAGGEDQKITPKAFLLLRHFVTNPGVLIGKEQLKLSVWGPGTIDPSSVDVKIRELRKAFERVDPTVEYIRNKHGQGWIFVVPVEKRTESPVQAIDDVVKQQEAPRGRRSYLAYAAAVLGFAISAGALFRIVGEQQSMPHVTDFRQLTNDGRPKEGRLLTDGRVIYFTEHSPHNADSAYQLATVSVSGGEVMYPRTPLQPALLFDIASGPGDRLYWTSARSKAGSLTLWKSKNNSLQSANVEADFASISPDGRTLAYGENQRHVLNIRDMDGGTTIESIPLTGLAENLRWSADGRRIRLGVYDAPSLSSSIWEVRPDGSHLRKLDIPGASGKSLAPEGWTIDGRHFIFSEHSNVDHASTLWIIPDDGLGFSGAKPLRLTTAPMNFHSTVAAPDGSTLFAIGAKSRTELVRFDLHSRAFVPFWEGFPAIDVAFSNDAKQAAFVRYPDFTLWTSRANGTDRRQLTQPTIEAHQPHWSPDGRKLAFMGQEKGKPWRIYVLDPSGGVPQAIKPDDPVDQGVPSWSPDGRSVVFGERRGTRPDSEMVIRIMDIATGLETILPGSKGKWSPRWSPDGRYILAQTTDFKELLLFNCRSQTWRSLARADSDNATWSVDGKFVHFDGKTERGKALFRVDIAGGKIEEFALQPEIEYPWSGVAPDGSPLTLRALKIEEIYALKLARP